MKRQRGFGYIEALVAVVLLAIAIVPALDALSNATRGAPTADRDDDLWQAVANKLSDVAGARFDDLDAAATAAGSATTATTLSDATTTTPRVMI